MTSEHLHTFDRPHRTWTASAFNAIGRRLRRWGWKRPLNRGDILNAARRWTRLSDFGDERFETPLQVLLDSLENDANLTPMGRFFLRLSCIFFVSNRLRVQHFLKLHPEARDEPIRRPLFVVGLPRTGTTLLHNLLCQDDGGRPLLLWEALQPALSLAATRGWRDRRPIDTRRFIYLVNRWWAPQLKSIHPLRADGPEECTFLLLNTFVTPAFFLYGNLRGYLEWLHGPGREYLTWAYEEYRTYLQVLQWGRPAAHWVLKSPAHSYGLETLLKLFPDACIVQTHRAMHEVIPSACSLFALSQGMHSDDVDCRRIGRDAMRMLSTHLLERVARARQNEPMRVFDVAYESLMNDPVSAVERLYDHFGMEVSEPMEQRMRQWLAANPANKHGVHRYDLEQFGLTREEIERAFGPCPQAEHELACVAAQ